MIHTDLSDIGNDMGGWFHVLEERIDPDRDDCNGPRSIIPRPLLRYSKYHAKTFLITYSNGMIIDILLKRNENKLSCNQITLVLFVVIVSGIKNKTTIFKNHCNVCRF